jgi:hypothetical protein
MTGGERCEVGLTPWIVWACWFPTEFRPVTLNQKEERVLEAKLDRLDPLSGQRDAAGRAAAPAPREPLTPEPYSEAGASRCPMPGWAT